MSRTIIRHIWQFTRYSYFIADPLLEPNPFIHDDAVSGPNFLGSSIENEFGSSGSTTSFKNDPLPVVGGLLLDSLDNDFDTPETFRTGGSQERYDVISNRIV